MHEKTMHFVVPGPHWLKVKSAGPCFESRFKQLNIFDNKKSNNAKKSVSECPRDLNAFFLDNIPIKQKFTKISRFSGFFQRRDN